MTHKIKLICIIIISYSRHKHLNFASFLINIIYIAGFANINVQSTGNLHDFSMSFFCATFELACISAEMNQKKLSGKHIVNLLGNLHG